MSGSLMHLLKLLNFPVHFPGNKIADEGKQRGAIAVSKPDAHSCLWTMCSLLFFLACGSFSHRSTVQLVYPLQWPSVIVTELVPLSTAQVLRAKLKSPTIPGLPVWRPWKAMSVDEYGRLYITGPSMRSHKYVTSKWDLSSVISQSPKAACVMAPCWLWTSDKQWYRFKWLLKAVARQVVTCWSQRPHGYSRNINPWGTLIHTRSSWAPNQIIEITWG